MPKKKREKKSVDGEPSKKFSENKIDTSGSIGSPGIIGEKIAFTQHINLQQREPKPMRVRSNRGEESLIWIGKRIMRALFGTLIHSMTGYTLGSSGIAGLGIVFSYFAFTRNPFPSGFSALPVSGSCQPNRGNTGAVSRPASRYRVKRDAML